MHRQWVHSQYSKSQRQIGATYGYQGFWTQDDGNRCSACARDEKIGEALKVFDIEPMTVDVVLRYRGTPRTPTRQSSRLRFVPAVRSFALPSTVHMYAAIDLSADKVTRQLRKFKTKVVDNRKAGPAPRCAGRAHRGSGRPAAARGGRRPARPRRLSTSPR